MKKTKKKTAKKRVAKKKAKAKETTHIITIDRWVVSHEDTPTADVFAAVRNVYDVLIPLNERERNRVINAALALCRRGNGDVLFVAKLVEPERPPRLEK